ncbi:phosphoribosylglycinamide formyltransferase [Globicatella sanguinis]|uniref:phosphoribosylglycinamide formyltransferase n=1 Tax=Globicatella sanguinis TaxID=13076 RepID=UPI002543AA66|nr:phosphoribosylglycinamide formyltransferase [Globicatella sanguinis]MDK7631390.1 phosphoribosylglycinamide formyltransferase [Globicatella sanguinis]WIK65943.1 phosphoribosylglycinamide formyltransferase [Globicatella sanguinis]WKT55348.1 phosphoribosylglycinamide formyltransferase [Globicatella sanguinis]
MRKIKLGVLISGGGSNLQAIIDACHQQVLDVEIAIVISSDATAYGLERARLAGIKTLTSRLEGDITSALQSAQVDYVILAGYLRKIGPELLAAYPTQILNIHPSLIPAFSGKGFYGLKVHEAVIKRGVKITGATTHLVNAELDEGPIIRQEVVHVLPEDTPESLQQRVLEIEHHILIESIKDLIGGNSSCVH